MSVALALGRRHAGMTGANPAVGCIIVADGQKQPRIVARGVTAIGGAPHAEALALDGAGGLAKGATAYVSLEPCAHHGKTPPCARALVTAGIRSVFYPLDDPDPKVRGKGRAMLEAGGVLVETGLLADQTARDLRGFLTRIRHGRPYVTLKLAISRDGKIAAAPGVKTTITGPLAQARVHLMRARSDAILVGLATVLADDPQLNCRLEGLETFSPVRVVLDVHAKLPLTSNLAQTAGDVPVWLMTGEHADPGSIARLKSLNVQVVKCPAPGGRLALEEVFKCLGDRGISSLMVESGARLSAALISQRLADEVVLFCAPDTLGANALDALAELPLSAITNSKEFHAAGTMTLEHDRVTRYIRRQAV